MKESLDEILEEYKDLIRTKAGLYFMLGGEKDDIIQEGMIGLFKAYQSYDESRGASFNTYASLCIDNQIISAIKAANTKKNSALNDSVEIPSDQIAGPSANPEDAAIYGDFIQSLKENKGGMFSKAEHSVLLKLLEYKAPAQIAVELEKTPKQIENTCQRIKNKVKNYFSKAL